MTDYAPRSSQDHNSFHANHQHFGMSHYSNGSGRGYIYDRSPVPYSAVSGPYTTYVPQQNVSTLSYYAPNNNPSTMGYQVLPPSIHSMPSQLRTNSFPSYDGRTLHTQRTSAQQSSLALGSDLGLNPIADIESQESCNQESMLSEPVVPPLEGYPEVDAFDELMQQYVADLSPKKQDKALIHSRRAHNIRRVLIDKKTTSVESAQFRFWVKKMFELLPGDSRVSPENRKICHEGKPVAIREKLFKILTKAHKSCSHGGRDKTSAQVRRVYSWVPKELISRFVKICPTCQLRRGSNRTSPPESENGYPLSPDSGSPVSRRQSLASKRERVGIHSPLSMAGFSPTFQQQNRWMSMPTQTETRHNQSNPYGSGSTGLPNVSAYGGSLIPTASRHYHSQDSSEPMEGVTFSNVSNMTGMLPSSGFPSSNVRTQRHLDLTPPNYGLKQEHHYG